MIQRIMVSAVGAMAVCDGDMGPALVAGAVVHDLSGVVDHFDQGGGAVRASAATLGSLSSCAATVAPS